MRLNTFRLVLLMATAFVAGLAGAYVGDRLHDRALGPVHDDSVTFRDTLHTVLAASGALTPAQKTAIDRIDDAYTIDHNLIRADLQASNTELAAALADDMSLNAAAQQAIRELQMNIGQMQTATVDYILSVRHVLTPEQRRAFDDHIVAAMMVHVP